MDGVYSGVLCWTSVLVARLSTGQMSPGSCPVVSCFHTARVLGGLDPACSEREPSSVHVPFSSVCAMCSCRHFSLPVSGTPHSLIHPLPLSSWYSQVCGWLMGWFGPVCGFSHGQVSGCLALPRLQRTFWNNWVPNPSTPKVLLH